MRASLSSVRTAAQGVTTKAAAPILLTCVLGVDCSRRSSLLHGCLKAATWHAVISTSGNCPSSVASSHSMILGYHLLALSDQKVIWTRHSSSPTTKVPTSRPGLPLPPRPRFCSSPSVASTKARMFTSFRGGSACICCRLSQFWTSAACPVEDPLRRRLLGVPLPTVGGSAALAMETTNVEPENKCVPERR